MSNGMVSFNYLWRLNELHRFHLTDKTRTKMKMMGLDMTTDTDITFTETVTANLANGCGLVLLQVEKLLVTCGGRAIDMSNFPPEQLRMTGEVA
jgi:hypothetical protein